MDIVNVVILGTLGMLLLATSIVAFVFIYQKKLIERDLKIQKMQAEYQKDLLKATIEAQEKERKRISQDLHDDIGAMLSTIKLSLVGLKRGANLDEKQSGRLQNTKELIDETVGNVRRLSRDLLPATLDEFGLIYALDQLFDKIKSNTILQVKFEHPKKLQRMEKIVELALYRIVQELCNNIIKHAHASAVHVLVDQTDDNFKIVVIDNGDGFPNLSPGVPKKKSLGLGLKNIESRLSMINATISYDLAPEKGTKVCINMGYILENLN